MATGQFNVGDIVQLKSGGPKMTVTTVPTMRGEFVHTAWFAGAKRESGAFPAEALVPVIDEPTK